MVLLSSENSMLIDHQKNGFAEVLEGQLGLKKLMTEMISKVV